MGRKKESKEALKEFEVEFASLLKLQYLEGIESALKMFERVLDREELPQILTKTDIRGIINGFREINNETIKDIKEGKNDRV
jgi:hypothetical protein